jgi:hypothetical protein
LVASLIFEASQLINSLAIIATFLKVGAKLVTHCLTKLLRNSALLHALIALR